MRNKTKKLVFGALMTALCVIIGWVCKSYFTFGAVRITFENLPILLSGVLLGPLYGAAVGIASDIITCLLSGYGVNPVITFGAAAVGVISGLFSQYIIKRKRFPNILLAVMSAHLVGSVVIKSFGLWMYGYAFPLLAVRLPLYMAIGIAESYLVYVILENRRLMSLADVKGNK